MIKAGVILLTFMFLFSCKNDTKNDNQVIENSVVETPKELVVKLGFKTSVKDEFRIMLNNIEIDEFQKKNILIRETVPVSSGFESIVANFGNNISNNLIINLGNKNLKEIELNGIEVSYGEKRVLVTNENIRKHFNINKFVEFDSIKRVFKTIKVAGKHQPSFVARRSLINILKKG
ncbi:hypothetical protein D778_01856 [Xanthomarina gelatinilytica]|uniref:Uncharacterized protein n=1 Tax=Xanthomarina gelatinilytica TaxID=1137281 RepID=M7MLJ2_9FLAO|nr:hypothetical protein [Xanthomarina gelatinilytica]EMQ95966.1 hypothetical protein D778_01856 [Xanthomarina gelatinilytica]